MCPRRHRWGCRAYSGDTWAVARTRRPRMAEMATRQATAVRIASSGARREFDHAWVPWKHLAPIPSAPGLSVPCGTPTVVARHGLPRRDRSGLWRTRIYDQAGARRRDASGPADVATAVLTCRKVAELPRKQAPRAASRTAGRRRRRCARGTEWGRSLGNTRRSPQPPRATTRSRRR